MQGTRNERRLLMEPGFLTKLGSVLSDLRQSGWVAWKPRGFGGGDGGAGVGFRDPHLLGVGRV